MFSVLGLGYHTRCVLPCVYEEVGREGVSEKCSSVSSRKEEHQYEQEIEVEIERQERLACVPFCRKKHHALSFKICVREHVCVIRACLCVFMCVIETEMPGKKETESERERERRWVGMARGHGETLVTDGGSRKKEWRRTTTEAGAATEVATVKRLNGRQRKMKWRQKGKCAHIHTHTHTQTHTQERREVKEGDKASVG